MNRMTHQRRYARGIPPRRRNGVFFIFGGVVGLIVGAGLLRHALRGSAAQMLLTPLGLLIGLANIGIPVVLILIGVTAFYSPRWVRRIITPHLRRQRNRRRNLGGQQLIKDFESDDLRARFRAHWRYRSLYEQSSPKWLRRLVAMEIQHILIVFVVPIGLFAMAGLALPPYAGPQPPATAIQWAHRIATRAASVLFSSSGVHLLLIYAVLLLPYMKARQQASQASSDRYFRPH